MFLNTLKQVFKDKRVLEFEEGSRRECWCDGSGSYQGMVTVARASGTGAEWRRGSEVEAVMKVEEGVQVLVRGVT